MINPILVDKTNWETFYPILKNKLQKGSFVGFDIETEDQTTAREGIKKFRKGNPTRAFDYHRTNVVGYSLYFDGEKDCYYLNINHADQENALGKELGLELLKHQGEKAYLVCHNGPFEISMIELNWGYRLPRVICTKQMAVSAWGPDEYDKKEFLENRLKGIHVLIPDIHRHFLNFDERQVETDEETGRQKFTSQQAELVSQVLSKISKSGHSYEGMIKNLAWGYGLKKLVEKHFKYKMQTFDETLKAANAEHMGQLTGEQVVSYGCDDAYWTVRLFHFILGYMTKNCPKTIRTFFDQENPMIYVFSDIKRDGWRISREAVSSKNDEERSEYAKELRKLKLSLRKLLPFKPEPVEGLMQAENWYSGLDKKGNRAKSGKDYKFYRARLEEWILSPNCDDDLEQVCQVSSAVTTGWLGRPVSDKLNLSHYYQTRVLLYDLCRLPIRRQKGKVLSDAEAISKCRTWAEKKEKKDVLEVLKSLTELSSIEQRMKLYLTPYQLLSDPETSRVYPDVTSMLATRRMAGSNPNTMQLAKRGKSTYIRGFYLPDDDESVLISLDWSQIELVLIGEFSGDPEFKKAYSQLPYQDLHFGAMCDIWKVILPEVNEEFMINVHKMDEKDIPKQLLIDVDGNPMDKSKVRKYWRSVIGKPANFGYWYSGALSDTADKMGWDPNTMWKAVEAYRERFSVAEEWRVGLIEEAKRNGFVTLPDGHRRVRWELTQEWLRSMHLIVSSYNLQGFTNFSTLMMKRIRSRSGNQIVNAMIQGSCATLAKRSILQINKRVPEEGIRATFKGPIHDEVIFSVHREDVLKFLSLAKGVMNTHPDIIKDLKVHCTASVGLTFEPFDKEKAPKGQIELDEAPDILGFEEGSQLEEREIEKVVRYLFDEEK